MYKNINFDEEIESVKKSLEEGEHLDKTKMTMLFFFELSSGGREN